MEQTTGTRESAGDVSTPPPMPAPTTTRVGAVVDADPQSQSFKNKVERLRGDRDLLSIAPMMEVTDRYYRTFMRNVTRHTKLYTEMVVDDTILHQMDNLDRFVGFDAVQHPVAIQLGGDNAEKLGKCSEVCEKWGYDEINLNCGCPSKRVVSKCFGAKLMLDPDKVREIASTMRRHAGNCPVTIKCRLGADERDSYEELCEFVKTASLSGVTHFIVHARKCLLDGLSTKQNRTIPELKYHWVFQLCRDFPDLEFSLNGHVETMAEAQALLRPIPSRIACDQQLLAEYLKRATAHTQKLGVGKRDTALTHELDDDSAVDAEHHRSTFLSTSTGAVAFGELADTDNDSNQLLTLNSVMIGRAAWHDPWCFVDADKSIFGASAPPHPSRHSAIRAYVSDYVEPSLQQIEDNKRRHDVIYRKMMVPVVNTFKGCRGGAGFARHLGRAAGNKVSQSFRDVVEAALEQQSASERKAKDFESRRRGRAYKPSAETSTNLAQSTP